MSLALVERDGTVKRRCVWCHQMRSEVDCCNPWTRKVHRKYFCRACHTEALEVAAADYRKQILAGIPKNLRVVLMPAFPAGSERLTNEVRERLLGIEREIEAAPQTSVLTA